MASQEIMEIMSYGCDENHCSNRSFLEHSCKPIPEVDCRGCYGERDCAIKKEVAKSGDRLLFQFKQIELYATYLEMEEFRRPVSIREATGLWVERGYAAKFAAYHDAMGITDPIFIFRASHLEFCVA